MDRGLRTLLKELERQGGRVKETKKGFMVYPPDPKASPVAIHKTPSDHRAWNNMRAELRRSGFNV